MSFILDALRKVDQENRTDGEVVPPVAAIERLRQERLYRRRQYAAMAVIAFGSAAATALLLRTTPTETKSSPEPAPQTAVVQGPVETPAPEGEPPITEAETAAPEPTPGPVEAIVAEPAPSEPGPAGEPAPAPAKAPDLPPEPPRLVLQGTSILDGRPVAVISDRRVFEGDTIEGAVVIRIEERSVELEFEGRRFTLTL